MGKPSVKMTLCGIMDVSADYKVVHGKSFILVPRYPTWQPANEHSKESQGAMRITNTAQTTRKAAFEGGLRFF
jgi:hypothetical protein